MFKRAERSGKKIALLLFGPPGVGKGKQGDWLIGSGLPVLKTSQLLDGSPEVRQIIQRGELVGCDQVLSVLFEQLADMGYPTMVGVDGAPRTVYQLRKMYAHLECLGYEVYILRLNAEDDLCLERMKRRDIEENRLDKGKGRKRLEVYHQETKPCLVEAQALGIKILEINIAHCDVAPEEISYEILKNLFALV